jgi:CsoR family transcriptional regulator, copper-sensing transcriptional repressor
LANPRCNGRADDGSCGSSESVATDTLGGYGTYMPGYDMSKDDLLARLRRIEGQIRGIAQMVEQDRYCIDVLTQVSAATKGLQSVAVGLFDDHLRHCVADAVATGGSDADRKLTEATAAVERLLKS